MTGYDSKRAAAADKLQEPPSEWASIKAILDEYGLQAIDFVADFKAALAQPAQEPIAKVCHDLEGHIGWNPTAKVNEFPEGMNLFAAAQAPTTIPDDLREMARAWRKDGYPWSTGWAEKLLDFVANYTTPPLPGQGQIDHLEFPGTTKVERQLRRMLCLSRSKRPYMDDGEASDASKHPVIDYMRDTPDEISAKWEERSRKTLAQPPAPLPAQEPVAWMCSAFDGEPCEQTNHDECGNPIPLYTAPPKRPWVGLTDEERDEVWKTHVLPGFHDRQKFYSPTIYAQLIEAKLKEKNT